MPKRRGRPPGQFEANAERLLMLMKCLQRPTAWAQQPYYADKLGVSERQVGRYVAHLRKTGRISISYCRQKVDSRWTTERRIRTLNRVAGFAGAVTFERPGRTTYSPPAPLRREPVPEFPPPLVLQARQQVEALRRVLQPKPRTQYEIALNQYRLTAAKHIRQHGADVAVPTDPLDLIRSIS